MSLHQTNTKLKKNTLKLKNVKAANDIPPEFLKYTSECKSLFPIRINANIHMENSIFISKLESFQALTPKERWCLRQHKSSFCI